MYSHATVTTVSFFDYAYHRPHSLLAFWYLILPLGLRSLRHAVQELIAVIAHTYAKTLSFPLLCGLQVVMLP